MIRPLPMPISIIGLGLAGIAIGAGWKLGCFLGELAIGEKTIDCSWIKEVFRKPEGQEPLWKRQFGKVSED